MVSIRTRIERELRAPEARADAALLGRLAEGSVAAYRHFLCDVYGFLVPLEYTLTFTGRMSAAFMAPRFRSGLVAADLLALGITRDEHLLLARRFEMVRFQSRIQALGWMYVAERMLHAHAGAREALPTSLAFATRYLRSYNHDTWCELVGRLEAHAFSAVARTEMLVAAHAATQRLCTWLDPTLSEGEAVNDERSLSRIETSHAFMGE